MASRPNPRRIFELAAGFMPAQAINAVVLLGVPDHLGDGSATVEDMAGALGGDAPALGRFLRFLESYDLFVQEGGAWRLTPGGQLLRSDVPHSMAARIKMLNAATYRGWGDALHTLRTGRPGFEKAFGGDFFAWLDEHPDEAETFHAAMIDGPEQSLALIDALDLEGVSSITDIAGGNGHFLSHLIAKHPGIRTSLVDMPAAIAAAQAGQGGPLPGCALVIGSFFDELPGGSDLYLLQKILHDWPVDQAGRILRTLRAAVTAGTRLAVLDMIVEPGRSDALLSDIYMLVQSGGCERTADQFETLLAANGFRMTRARQTSTRLGIVDAVAV
jgi:hypothetical protein